MYGVFQNIDPTPPHRPASVYPPAFGAGGGPGVDSHLEISVNPMLGDSLYTRDCRLGARAWQGFVANLSI
jgi:hypothetical protein